MLWGTWSARCFCGSRLGTRAAALPQSQFCCVRRGARNSRQWTRARAAAGGRRRRRRRREDNRESRKVFSPPSLSLSFQSLSKEVADGRTDGCILGKPSFLAAAASDHRRTGSIFQARPARLPSGTTSGWPPPPPRANKKEQGHVPPPFLPEPLLCQRVETAFFCSTAHNAQRNSRPHE